MNEELSNIELEAWVTALKWERLKQHKPEFIAKMVIKALRVKGVHFLKITDAVEYEVVPVTEWTKNTVVARDTTYVYEALKGYKGVILRETKSGSQIKCLMRLRRKEGETPFVTEILKSDIQPCET